MKKLFLLLSAAFLLAGCSDESPEEIGVGISARLAQPIQDAEKVSEKVKATREMPPMN